MYAEQHLYRNRRPHQAPNLSVKNRKLRLLFKWAHQNRTIEDWKMLPGLMSHNFCCCIHLVESKSGVTTWMHWLLLPRWRLGEDHSHLPPTSGERAAGPPAVCLPSWFWGGWCSHLPPAQITFTPEEYWKQCESHVFSNFPLRSIQSNQRWGRSWKEQESNITQFQGQSTM